ncbi:glycoside hydrolase family 172 protein [Saccharicrinis sp. GN24d3]|uniref:glycoside hydrolase family 172 protein n=1 Tax=Saccharicrinis sp. GN24d3 TaxID=3458416 RepID=UPI0040350F7F
MKHTVFFICSLILLILFSGACTFKQSDQDVTIKSLLKEMVDRDGLAKLSEYQFKTLQASSYSRKSVAANQEGWFDNADASQFVRVDTTEGRIEHVLMDVDGPGAIVRFWSTWHAQRFSMGTLRFYFDNSPTPQIQGRIDEIISSNKFVGAPLSQTASAFLENDGWFSGHNLYFPLTYAKHCKVTYQKADESINDVLYYQLNYRQYEAGTSVATYTEGDWESDKYKDAIATVNRQLSQYESVTNKCQLNNLEGLVKAGESISTSIAGNRVIKKIAVKITANNLEQALRSTVIAMEFDGKKTVWAPVGDLFGTGYKISAYEGWLARVSDDGEMTMFFPMPFQNAAKITVHNFGKEDIELIKMDMHHTDWKWDEQSLYFHANWRNYPDVETSEKKDVNFITISGKGKYVGDVLTLFNDSYVWWGEGDEKIFVDGEQFPSNFGTGTEDYYGYAWCSVVDFSAPFNAQPTGDGNRSPGLTVNSRWRSLDVIPFDRSLKFDMEIWHWASTQMDYAPTTFWYGTKDASARFMEDPESVKIPVKLTNKFEAEGFKIEKIKGGEVIRQAFLSHEWSAQNHLLWKDINKSDKLETVFYSEKERKGELMAVFTHAPDYVIVDVLLNGELIFENLDLYSDKLSLKEYTFEKGRMKKGKNSLTLIVKGTNKSNPKADKLGLDYLVVK